MDNELTQLVRTLTKQDKKTLSQKGLKLTEETGELAKNILAYEMADGSLHKYASENTLLEDCVDVMLVAQSILYDLKFTDAQIHDAMYRKAVYWAGLQNYEATIDPARMPHEIHVTVSNVTDIEKFKRDCVDIKVKPIVLDLHSKDGTVFDMMTSSVIVCPSSAVQTHVRNNISDKLKALGYTVIREKIEVPPMHPAVPRDSNTNMYKAGNYLESHIEVIIDKTSNLGLSRLVEWADSQKYKIHVSKNFFKRLDTVSTIMLTSRSSEMRLERFTEHVNHIRTALDASGFTLTGKSIIEFSLFDSNSLHDTLWLRGNDEKAQLFS